MVKIYHNPRCSKSRQALELLKSKNIDPEIVLYLEKPLSSKEVENILKMLKISAIDIMRKKEDEFSNMGLSDSTLDEKYLIEAIVKSPKLLERPIVINGNKAAIGRPLTNILEIL